ncbi:hypothetical protein F4779DRAFT_241823 [Xylariaceae sp. FL0662B]|nr:hypothetical protein F4779DRAFT_241823 [Xylariaceae sp. FL0662B]
MLNRGFKFDRPPDPPLHSPGSPSPYKSLVRDNSPSRKDFNRDGSRERGGMASNIDFEPNELSFQDVLSLMDGTGYPKSDERLRKSRGSKRPQQRFRGGYDGKNYALKVSAATGRLQTVSTLLEWKSVLGISMDEVLGSLTAAATYGHLEVFRLISDALPSPLPIGNFLAALKEAAANGHTDIVSLGIEQASMDS